MGFENLPKNKSISTSEILHANAKTLLATAENAAEIGSYGIARSLAILGSEEYIKGCILYLRGMGINVDKIAEVKKALKQHKERHQLAMLFKLFKIIEGFANFRKFKGPSGIKVSLLNSIPHYLREVQSLMKVMIDVGDDLGWWEKANDYKNEGFYVDYFNGVKSPSSVTVEDYEIAKVKVKDLTQRFRVLKLVFERASSDKDRKELVYLINQAL